MLTYERYVDDFKAWAYVHKGYVDDFKACASEHKGYVDNFKACASVHKGYVDGFKAWAPNLGSLDMSKKVQNIVPKCKKLHSKQSNVEKMFQNILECIENMF